MVAQICIVASAHYGTIHYIDCLRGLSNHCAADIPTPQKLGETAHIVYIEEVAVACEAGVAMTELLGTVGPMNHATARHERGHICR